jgi:hypothetical protein
LKKKINIKLHVSPQIFLFNLISNFMFPHRFKKIIIKLRFPTDFGKNSKVPNFHKNPSSESPFVPGGQTDNKSNEGLRNSATAHKERFA